MKKRKECLFFIVPLAILIAFPILVFASSLREADMLGSFGHTDYLKLFLNDDIFWKAVFNTYGRAMIFSFLFSFAAISVFTLIRYRVKVRFLNRAVVYHLVHVALGSVISFVILLVKKITLLGVPTDVYAPGSLVNTTPPSVIEAISVYEIVLALQVAVFTAFVFWLIELAVYSVKSRKAKEN